MTKSTTSLGKPFLTLWAGQTISEIGSTLSGVAAGFYIFLETGSAAWLGLITAVSAIPAVLMGIAGSVIDRYPRRHVMIIADMVAVIAPAIALALAIAGQLQVWHIVLVGFVASLGNAAQTAASQAAVPALVDASQLERAHSLKQLGAAAGVVIGPIAATPILVYWGIEAILIIDLVTFVFGIAAVTVVKFADPPREPLLDDDGSWRDMWSWLRGPGVLLLTLMVVTGALNLSLAFFNIAILVAATVVAGAAKAGLVLGLGGVAMVAGSVVSAGLGRSPDRIKRIGVALAMVGSGFVIAGLRPNIWVQVIGVAIALAAVPAVSATFGAIFNERVPAQMQGRVFALRGSLGQVLQSIGALIGGVAVASVFEPAMRSRLLSGSLGRFIGTGPSSGAAFMLILSGVSIGLIGLWLLRSGVRDQLRTPNPTGAELGRSDEPIRA